jgi:putative transposase
VTRFPALVRLVLNRLRWIFATGDAEAQLSVSRFSELIGVPRRTYTNWLAKHRAGDPAKGPRPAPIVDRIEPVVAKYARDWRAWGHRKVRAIAAIDGHDVGSESSVQRANGPP